jgi:hemoglobin
MKRARLISALVGIGILLASAAVAAAGSAQAGSAKSMYCSGCHGVDGNAAYPSARLAGQAAQRIQQSMMDFKTGRRFHPVMNILSLGMTQQDIDDLAMFYAAQKPLSLENASLYWRLGGGDAINAAADELIKVSQADPRMNGGITGKCRDKLKEQLCAATGGPCTYTGRDMKTAHKGLHITDAEFDAVADNLVKVLDAFKVQEREKNELLGLIAPMRGDIVGQ